MRIKLLRPDLENDYIFQIQKEQETYLTSSDYNDKTTCLENLKTVLINLRDNEQIAIQSGNNNQYYFEVAGLAQSPSFDDLDKASDVLALLKEFTTTSFDFSVSYEKPSKKAVSKKQLGLREEAYNFTRKSVSNQPGFELLDSQNSVDKYFHFNNAKGNPILFSRVYDGKTRRLKAINEVIKQTKSTKNIEVIKQRGQFFFIFKTKDGYEIARSKNFASRDKMESAMAYITAEAANFKADFKIPKKKKKKKRKANEKYHLKQVAPLGLVGFEGFRSTKNKLHYFHYNDKKGQALLFSKPYNKRSSRDENIAKIIKIGAKKNHYKIWKKSKNQYYFSIIDNKDKSFARSRYFSTEKKMLTALKTFKTQVANHKEAVNVVAISKEKKYSIQLPEKVIPVVAKGLITEKSVPIIPAVIPIEQPDVIPTILPQSTVKIERAFVEIEEEVEAEAEETIVTETQAEAVTETPEVLEIATPTISEKAAVLPPPVVKPHQEPSLPVQREIVEASASSGFSWKWVILGAIALASLFFLLKNCNAPEAKVTPTPIPKVIEKPRPKPVEPAKLGPTALELNLTSNTAEANIADFLSTPKVQVPKTFILESVQFPFNSAVLTPTSYSQLDNVARVMTEYPNAKIEVNGHTDSRGEETMNLVLSQKRAEAVQAYLMGKGIATDRIVNAIGFGESSPIATNDTEEGMQENRRSEVVIVAR